MCNFWGKLRESQTGGSQPYPYYQPSVWKNGTAEDAEVRKKREKKAIPLPLKPLR
jgi:hypothetical protein